MLTPFTPRWILLPETYQACTTLLRILSRMQLTFRPVAADTGGAGSASTEFHVLMTQVRT